MNKNLVADYFQINGEVELTLKFGCKLSQDMLEDTIGLEYQSKPQTQLTYNSPINFPYDLVIVKNHHVMYDPIKIK